MKLACEKCSKVFIVRTSDVKSFSVGDFICPDCQTPLHKTGKIKDGFRIAVASVKKILTEEAMNKSITRKLVKLYSSLREQKISSMDLTIN